MDMQKLIDLITKEVMDRLGAIEKVTEVNKKKLLLLDSISHGCLNVVSKALNDEYEIDSLDNIKYKLEEYEACIVSRLENKQLASIANGLCSSSMEELVMNFLLMGKKVYLLEDGIEYRKYLDTASSSLLELYKGYEGRLTKYGVKIIKNYRDILDINETREPIKTREENEKQFGTQIEKSSFANSIDLIGKKLITEADLRKLCRNGVNEVLISKKSVITPLAQDFIRINRLSVKKV